MMNILNVFLVWALLICVVIFISDNGPQKQKVKKNRKIVLPTIVVPQIQFKTVTFSKPIFASEVEKPIEAVAPLITNIAENTNIPIVTKVVEPVLVLEPEIAESEHFEVNSLEVEGHEILPDIDPDDDSHLDVLLNLMNDDSIDVSILTSDSEDNDDGYIKEEVISEDDDGVWTENLIKETAEIEFDPESFYSDTSSVNCEVSSGTF